MILLLLRAAVEREFVIVRLEASVALLLLFSERPLATLLLLLVFIVARVALCTLLPLVTVRRFTPKSPLLITITPGLL